VTCKLPAHDVPTRPVNMPQIEKNLKSVMTDDLIT